MKKMSPNEASFIFAIHNTRYNTNEILLITPWLVALAFAIIGAPIITALCDNRASRYFAVSMEDLQITEETSKAFENETAKTIRLSDLDEMGRVVNVKLFSRIADSGRKPE